MSRILKVVSLDSGSIGGALGSAQYPSRQLLEDPFSNFYGTSSIPEPPYSMEQLVMLAEAHPIHAAAIEQKVEDIVSTGPEFVPLNPDQTSGTATDSADLTEQASLMKWWNSLNDEFTMLELLQSVWNDYETTGWGLMELARDPNGVIRQVYHLPAHTVRISRDGTKFVQMRNGKMAWFKKWNSPQDILVSSGNPISTKTSNDNIANEVLVFKKPSRRSTFYGIPVYVSAIGHITLAIAARDYNILFFDNSREPRHVFIVSGLDEDVEETLDDLENNLRTQHKDPHRNLLLPIVGEAKVTIQTLSAGSNDMQFIQLSDKSDEAILVAHRMPADRLGLARRGFLGGSVAEITNRIYKDGVISKGQGLLEDRLTKFMNIEYPKWANKSGAPNFQISFQQLDITDDQVDTTIVVARVAQNLITLNEGRARLGLSRHDDFADMTLTQWLVTNGYAPGGAPPGVGGATTPGASVGGAQTPDSVGQSMSLKSRDNDFVRQAMLARMEEMDTYILELMTKNPNESALQTQIVE